MNNNTSRITPSFTGDPWESSEKHLRILFPEPGFCHFIFDGTPSVDELALAFRQIKAFACSHACPAMLTDVSHINEFPTELRKLPRESSNVVPMNATAIIGAGFHLRVVATLLIKVMRLTSRVKLGPIAFVATEEEGWIWLKEQVAKELT